MKVIDTNRKVNKRVPSRIRHVKMTRNTLALQGTSALRQLTSISFISREAQGFPSQLE